MSLSVIRTKLTERVAGVSGVANVTEYKYWVTDIDSGIKLDSGGKAHWWDVSVTRIRMAPFANSLVQVYYDFLITGHIAARFGTDQNQTEMEEFVNSICLAMLADNDFDGTVEPGDDVNDESGIENVGIPEAEILLGPAQDGSIDTYVAAITITLRDATIQGITA